MKKCSICGNMSDSKFCPECGARMPESAMEESDPEIPEEKEPEEPEREEECAEEYEEEIPVTEVIPANGDAPVKEKMSKKKKGIIAAVIAVIFLTGVVISDTSDTETGDYETGTTTEEDYDDGYDDSYETDSEPEEEPLTEEEEGEKILKAAEDFDTDQCKTISYDNLARTPDKYTGDSVKLSGRVIQVIEGDDNSVQLRVATDDDYDQVVLVEYDKRILEQRVLEDDYITYYGMYLGTYTYESTMGGDITVPAVYIEKIEM